MGSPRGTPRGSPTVVPVRRELLLLFLLSARLTFKYAYT